MNEQLNQIEKDAKEYVSRIPEPVAGYAKLDFKAGAISQNNKVIETVVSIIQKGFALYTEQKREQGEEPILERYLINHISSLKITDK